jgi:CheY-like chemotaxis protein
VEKRMKLNQAVLLVEDDVVDQMNVKQAFRDVKILNKLNIAVNGLEALNFLRTGSELPCLILLDLNMPKMNGIEFLQELRKDEKIGALPVVVLTTSREDRDRVESFKLNVAGYMIKPVDYQQFVNVIRTIDLYWTLSELP